MRGKAVLKNLSYSSMMIFCFPAALVDAVGAFLHAVVELLQGDGFFLQGLAFQHIQHVLHRHRNGVVLGEVVAFKQGIEHGLGDQVLGEHVDGVGCADGGVEVVLQAGEEFFEGLAGVRGCCLPARI